MPVPATDVAPERTLLRDSVREKIRVAILDGTLEPGERLNDEELIAWLGVSRTPIREALSDLAGAGLVEMAANRYTRVATPSPDEILDAYRTLGVLFGGVVRLVVPVLTPDQRDVVVAMIDETRDRMARHEAFRVAMTSSNAYAVWLDACPNRSLVNVCRKTLDGLTFRLRFDDIEDRLPMDEIREHLGELREAVVAGDPIAAELAMEAAHTLPPRS